MDAIAKRAPAFAEHAVIRIHAHNAPSKNILHTHIKKKDNLILMVHHEVVSPLARSDTEIQEARSNLLMAYNGPALLATRRQVWFSVIDARRPLLTGWLLTVMQRMDIRIIQALDHRLQCVFIAPCPPSGTRKMATKTHFILTRFGPLGARKPQMAHPKNTQKQLLTAWPIALRRVQPVGTVRMVMILMDRMLEIIVWCEVAEVMLFMTTTILSA